MDDEYWMVETVRAGSNRRELRAFAGDFAAAARYCCDQNDAGHRAVVWDLMAGLFGQRRRVR